MGTRLNDRAPMTQEGKQPRAARPKNAMTEEGKQPRAARPKNVMTVEGKWSRASYDSVFTSTVAHSIAKQYSHAYMPGVDNHIPA